MQLFFIRGVLRRKLVEEVLNMYEVERIVQSYRRQGDLDDGTSFACNTMAARVNDAGF